MAMEEAIPYPSSAERGLCLAPAAVIGLGDWGADVARRFEGAIHERSPDLARACPVIALSEEEGGAEEAIRAVLRASRAGELIRALEQEGLIRLDPVIAPTTHVYLVTSGAADPDLVWLRTVAQLVERVAGELKARVAIVALVDVGGAPVGQVAAGAHRFPLYLVEPLTSHGLVIADAEYRAAMVEVLIAVAQPGGSQLLVGSPAGPATLGIAWLSFSPAGLRVELARRLSREAVIHCTHAVEPPSLGTGVRETEAWGAQQERLPALCKGLGFTVQPDLRVALPKRFCGEPAWRRQRAQHLRRVAAVLQRRAEQWADQLERNGRAAAAREAEAVERSVAGALAAGPDGLARAERLARGLAREAGLRLEEPGLSGQADLPHRSRLVHQIGRLERAEAMPEAGPFASLILGLFAVSLPIWWALGHHWPTLICEVIAVALIWGAYTTWRPRAIARATRAAVGALRAQAEAMGQALLLQRLAWLDRSLEARCTALADDLARAPGILRETCREVGAPGLLREAGAAGEGAVQPGALSVSLIAGLAIEPLYAELLPLVPALASTLSAAGALGLWRQPEALLTQAEEVAARFVAARFPVDLGHLAARTYGERLAERLGHVVGGLLDWSRPLLAWSAPLPEGQRWLLWPEGLPCPPVPADVTVLPAARSCAAALTVIRGLQRGEMVGDERQERERLA